MKKTTILIAPLNWGLGHATRCIPIIQTLLSLDAEVVVATDGVALALLRKVFPELPTVELPGYNVTYQKQGSFAWNLFRQFPAILRTINDEHQQLDHCVKTLGVDAVISDNRFGMWHPDIPSRFITHQLFTKLHGGLKLISPLLHMLNHSKIRKFDEVWVPDFEGGINLSGELSHQPVRGIKVSFIGWLSHFSNIDAHPQSKAQYDIATILSGPEPQRTLLEQNILPQLEASGKRCLLVRGLPDQTKTIESNTVKIVNYLAAPELSQAMLASEVIVCRSGYTSLMDLAYLQKKAILIPTPGQAEQEYLADYFQQQGYSPAENQESLNLEAALKRLPQFRGIPRPPAERQLENHLKELLKRAAR